MTPEPTLALALAARAAHSSTSQLNLSKHFLRAELCVFGDKIPQNGLD